MLITIITHNVEVRNGMKICSICEVEKDLSFFSKDSRRSDGLRADCKLCAKKRRDEYRKTKDGVVAVIYSGQRISSKRRGHAMPDYTKSDLSDWLLAQNRFHKLFNLWAENGYKKMEKPSCDRLDDHAPYSLSMLRVVTWKENNEKGHSDIKNGVNNKISKAVKQISLDGRFVKEHYSASQASRDTGANRSLISLCCAGKVKTAGGYLWRF
jgi:hypothetical protein